MNFSNIDTHNQIGSYITENKQYIKLIHLSTRLMMMNF